MTATFSQSDNRPGRKRHALAALGAGLLLGAAATRVWIRPPAGLPPRTEAEAAAQIPPDQGARNLFAVAEPPRGMGVPPTNRGPDARATPDAADFASASDPSDPPDPAPTVPESAPDAPPDLAGELQSALEENQQLRERWVDLANWILANFQGRVPLPTPLLARLDLPVLDEMGVLHPELESFLGISPSERDAINRALATARADVVGLRRAGLQIEFPDERRMIAFFPSFPDEGEAVRRRLFSDLHAALGARRLDRMLPATRNGMRQSFDDFGLSERRIEFAVVLSPEPGGEVLEIRDETRIPEEDGSIRVRAREITARDLPADYEFLFRETSGESP